MDTKSRSVKPALAFLAFVLGVTLLVYSAAAAVIVTVASRGSFYIPWRDIFWTDYQTTDSFHSFIKDRLYELATAADPPEEENPLEGWDDGLLYRVRADGVLRFSNTDPLSPDRLPDGYGTRRPMPQRTPSWYTYGASAKKSSSIQRNRNI